MSTQLWTAPNSSIPLLFVGRLAFDDIAIPVIGKDEWGLDTLERTVRGPIFLFEAYIAALRQGQIYKGCYLQSWTPSPHPFAPQISLRYKGLQAGLPDPRVTHSRAELMSSISASGLSISHNGKKIISATKEIKYIAPQATFNYIKEGEPEDSVYGASFGGRVQVIDSRITASYDDGTTQVFVGTAPDALATALFINPAPFVTGPSGEREIGTPWWKCEENVQLRYPSS